MAFSMPPFCQGARVSQKKVWIPTFVAQDVMESELGTVVEGNGLSKIARQGNEHGFEAGGHVGSRFVWLTDNDEEARGSLVDGEHGLAVGGKEHEVGFPVAWIEPIGGHSGALMDRRAVLDVQGGATAFAAPPTALALGAGKIVAPGVVLGAGDLGGDEAIDGFMADHGLAVFAGQASGDLLGRPAAGQPVEDLGLKVGIAQQPAPAPAPGFGLLASIGRLVGGRAAGVARQLPRDARWRAIQSCRNLPDRLPADATAGNLAPFLETELLVASSQRNTPPRKCCTSFVNLGAFVRIARSR